MSSFQSNSSISFFYVAGKHSTSTQVQSPIICLMGPTAAGKTALALEVADQFNCEIISVDSALVYRGMDIGTAKPDVETLRQYPHHLIDIIDPVDTYSVANFRRDSLGLIGEIIQRKKIPLLVGGSMLYFNALEKGLSLLPKSDPLVRRQLNLEIERHGPGYLHERLADIDPQAANRIHKNDSQRILRALEVWRISGTTLTDHCNKQSAVASPFKSIKLCMTCDERSMLHRRIAARFNVMVNSGFVKEVENLKSKYSALSADFPSMRCVGYRQVWNYLDGKYRRDEMLEKGIAATRQLAKRQLTWLRGMKNIHWFDSEASPRPAIFSLLDSQLESEE